MRNRRRLPIRPIRFVVVTAGVLAAGVTAAFALTEPPERPRLEPVAAEVDSSSSTSTTPTTDTTVADRRIEDVSGPCDEAEHADDPRCAGSAPSDDRDRGANRGHDDRNDDDDDDREDRSGSNSGPG